MERLTERKNGVAVYKHPTPEPKGWEVNRHAVLEKCCYYEDLEERLKKVYGGHEGMLETIVNHLEKHKGVDIGNPAKALLLTDDDVDKWKKTKEIWKTCMIPTLKIGQIVYVLSEKYNFDEEIEEELPQKNNYYIQEDRITKICLFRSNIRYGKISGDDFLEDDIGKTVFLSKEKAEKVLKKGKWKG